MTVLEILLPLFVEVGLTFVLLFWMAGRRTHALTSHAVRPDDVALGEPAWPAAATQVANCFRNQFELPVLFYVLVALALQTRHADLLFVVMAWIFVLLRIAHAYVHTTFNRVQVRGAVYGLGALVLFLMWIIFAVRVILGI
jgi:hypothetical protein